MDYIIVAVLLLFSALFSGLTLGLMGLSAPELKRKMHLGDKEAAKVYEVRKRGNLLLTTLLVGNVAINSALAIFLGSIAAGFTAGLIATGLIVIFGEIIPQAIFSRYALLLGAKVVWVVKIFIYTFYIITWPISWVLDKTLGQELGTVYSKQELAKIIDEHEEDDTSDIDKDEARIVKGAITFSEKIVENVMTPRAVVNMLDSESIVDSELINSISEMGHSKIPVYENNQDNIIGILYMKALLGEKNMGKRIKEIVNTKVSFIDENQKLDEVFNQFLGSRQHLSIVQNEFGEMVGIITLEDIIEEIIDSEIVDEFDKHPDMREFALNKHKN